MTDALLGGSRLHPHWSTKRLRYLASINDRKLSDSMPADAPLRYMDISSVNGDGSRQEPEEMLFENAPSRARRLAREGDTAIATVRTYLKAIAFVDEGVRDCIWSTGFAIVSPGAELHPRFLYYIARSSWFVAEVRRRSVGVSYPAVNADDIADILCPVPPLDEQRRIADFLDDEIARLDELAQLRSRLHAYLEERWQAIVWSAVATRDGVGWVTLPLKQVAEIRVSNVDKKSVDGQTTVRLCNYTDVYYRDTIAPDQQFMAASATREQIESFRLRRGDVIITKDSETPDDIGEPAFVAESAPDLVCGYHLAVLRPRSDAIDGRYLHWSMSSSWLRGQLAARATGVTRFGLRTEVIANALVNVPPVDEQRRIADLLDREKEQNDAVASRLERQMKVLEERRQALITAAVTGQLDPSSYSVSALAARRWLSSPPPRNSTSRI